MGASESHRFKSESQFGTKKFPQPVLEYLATQDLSDLCIRLYCEYWDCVSSSSESKCCCSGQDIADRLNITRQSLQKAKRELVDRHLIKVEHNPGSVSEVFMSYPGQMIEFIDSQPSWAGLMGVDEFLVSR